MGPPWVPEQGAAALSRVTAVGLGLSRGWAIHGGLLRLYYWKSAKATKIDQLEQNIKPSLIGVK